MSLIRRTSIEDKRAAIKKVYDSASWDLQVDAMTDAQVTAIYMRFKEQGKLR